MDQKAIEKCESRLYVGNLDPRITEANVIKMFSPYGKIISEDFLWHTRGPKRGEPRGYVFIQYSDREEAQLAKAKLNGRMVNGRPLVVRLANNNYAADAADHPVAASDAKKPSPACSTSVQMTRSAKIAAIKNKLKSLEEQGCGTKKPRLLTEDP